MKTALAVTALLLTGSALLAGCGGGGYSSGTTGAKSASTAPPAAGSHRLTATESEYKIVLSSASVPAGKYVIEAVNNGAISHTLAINGPGTAGTQTSSISPGASSTLKVTLSKGTYDLYCTVPGHKALGMDAKLTVS
jgi:plastocyanin